MNIPFNFLPDSIVFVGSSFLWLPKDRTLLIFLNNSTKPETGQLPEVPLASSSPPTFGDRVVDFKAGKQLTAEAPPEQKKENNETNKK